MTHHIVYIYTLGYYIFLLNEASLYVFLTKKNFLNACILIKRQFFFLRNQLNQLDISNCTNQRQNAINCIWEKHKFYLVLVADATGSTLIFFLIVF